MSDYISREAALKAAEHAYGEWNLAMAAADGARQINLVYKRQELLKAVASVFDIVPAADVAKVRHGRWECVYDYYTGETDITCSHCKNTRTVNGCFVSTNGQSCYFEDDYCPNCGAKMDLEDENGT